ncbi:uncharacterized protein LOC119598896 isoform X1 [Penaeus monodon]|uniref:uncharacterized protein LOC119598896 isoform X1 n=1 Tax=Penaeus monodon TaxID=6687 RepID=UPI0018A7D9C7|nr:uncharacterized protein LOC119598896 isoform X1 [Penaeus monodon]
MEKLQGCLKAHAVRTVLLMTMTVVCFPGPCSSIHNYGNDTTTRNKASDHLIANRILPFVNLRGTSKSKHQHLGTNNHLRRQTTTSAGALFNRSANSNHHGPPTLPGDTVISALPSRRLLSTTQDHIQADDDFYKFIASHNAFLMLCDHPSHTFSNKFFYNGEFYDPEANCTFNKGFINSFFSVAEFCEYLFGLIYNTDDLIKMHILGKMPKLLYHNKTFENLCVPFYKVKYGCKSTELFTTCNNNTVIFLDSEVCPRPPPMFTDYEYYVGNYIETNNLHCLAKICDGTYHAIESEVSGVKFKASNFFLIYENKSCDEFNFVGTFTNESVLYMYINNHWPCCFPMYTVHWAKHPESHGLNGVWNFLPFSCRVGEICLIVLVACVATGGVAGNLMVIVVMLRISNRSEESNMLRLSLAVADFLTCVFVVLPSLYEHVKPLLIPLEPIIIHKVDEMDEVVPGDAVDRTTMYFPLRFFQGQVFTACSIVSLLTLFLLSAERFVMTGRGLRYKHYITPPRVRQAMVISWIIGWVNSSLMVIFGRTVSTVTWKTFIKIPVGLSNYAHEDLVVYTCYIIHIFLLSISIPATILLSVLSIKNFVQEQNRMRERWHKMQMRVSGPYESENCYIFVTQLLMTVFFLISVIPLSFYFLNFNLLQLKHFSPLSLAVDSSLYEYLSWWLFLASTAWNPWIYNMRSHNFRTELCKVKYVCIPMVLRKKWRSRHTQENRVTLTRQQKLLSRVGIYT